MSKLINFETAKLAAEVGFDKDCYHFYEKLGWICQRRVGVVLTKNWNAQSSEKDPMYSAPTKEELSDWLRTNHKMFISITPVVITSLDDITFKGTIFYFKDCWRLAPALNSTDYDKLYDDLLYKALTLIKSV